MTTERDPTHPQIGEAEMRAALSTEAQPPEHDSPAGKLASSGKQDTEGLVDRSAHAEPLDLWVWDGAHGDNPPPNGGPYTPVLVRPVQPTDTEEEDG